MHSLSLVTLALPTLKVSCYQPAPSASQSAWVISFSAHALSLLFTMPPDIWPDEGPPLLRTASIWGNA